MTTEAELTRRRGFLFRTQVAGTIHNTTCITLYDPNQNPAGSCLIEVGWLLSTKSGFRHAFISAPEISIDFRLLLRDGFPMKQLQELLDGLEITWGNSTPLMDDRGTLSSTPPTNRIYIFTGRLNQERSLIKSLFRVHGFEAIIIDDERWAIEWEESPADLFICHDSRDKPRIARPLSEVLTKRSLKVWLDDFAIKPGNDFVSKIDHGLATSRHALLVLTKRFLKNDRWASQEMSALLGRQFTEKRDDLVIPLYVGVSWQDVQSRSPLLAKASPIRATAMRFDEQINAIADEICRTVCPL